MPIDSAGPEASALLADLLAARLADPAAVSDAAIVETLSAFLHTQLEVGPDPYPRVLGFELDAVTDHPEKVRIDGWVVLEPPGEAHVRRPVGLEFVHSGQGVMRIASNRSDRPFGEPAVLAADLTGEGWQAAFFVGRPRA